MIRPSYGATDSIAIRTYMPISIKVMSPQISLDALILLLRHVGKYSCRPRNAVSSRSGLGPRTNKHGGITRGVAELAQLAGEHHKGPKKRNIGKE
jgi:hypothetical protein